MVLLCTAAVIRVKSQLKSTACASLSFLSVGPEEHLVRKISIHFVDSSGPEDSQQTMYCRYRAYDKARPNRCLLYFDAWTVRHVWSSLLNNLHYYLLLLTCLVYGNFPSQPAVERKYL